MTIESTETSPGHTHMLESAEEAVTTLIICKGLYKNVPSNSVHNS